MTLDEAFAELAAPDGFKPHDAAIDEIFEQWDAAVPRACALLHDYVGGQPATPEMERILYHLIHVLAEGEAGEGFADICVLAGDPERADLILGEDLFDALPCILISCFNDDTAPLRQLIEKADAAPVVRAGALLARAYVTQVKAITQAEMQAYLVKLHDLFPEEPGSALWTAWVDSVGLLGFRGLAARAQKVLERGLVAPRTATLAGFQDALRFAQEEPGSLDGFTDMAIYPFSFYSEMADMGDDAGYMPAPEPVTNPLRNVGRNDPCPCGSGKKYKKCCLAA